MIQTFLRNAALALIKPYVQAETLDDAVRVSALGWSVLVDHKYVKVSVRNEYELDVNTWRSTWCPPGLVWSKNVGGLSVCLTSVPLRNAGYAKPSTEQVSLN